jgi:hypothetical protein
LREKKYVNETLYDLVEGWTKQSWDGIYYLNIIQNLGEILDEKSHSGKYLGAIIGVLEGTVKSLHEMMEDNILTEPEVLQNLRKLLKDSDFRKGAKKIEVIQPDYESKKMISILNLQELNHRKLREKVSTPDWWRGSVDTYWYLIIGIYFGIVLGIYSIFIVQGLLELLLVATFFTGPIGVFLISYYSRRVKYQSVFRSTLTASMIIAGISWLCFVIPLFFSSNAVSEFVFQSLLVIIYGMMIGSFSGEWLGKRQSYISYI